MLPSATRTRSACCLSGKLSSAGLCIKQGTAAAVPFLIPFITRQAQEFAYAAISSHASGVPYPSLHTATPPMSFAFITFSFTAMDSSSSTKI